MIYAISASVALPNVTLDFLDGFTLSLGGEMLFQVFIGVALKYESIKEDT